MGGNFVRKRWQNSPPCRDLQTERSHEARGRWMKVDTVSTFWLVSHTVLSVCILILWQYKWYDAEIHAAHSSGFIWLTSSTVQCFPKDLANILRTWGPTIPGSPRSPSGPGSPCRGKEVYNLWNLCITNTQTHTSDASLILDKAFLFVTTSQLSCVDSISSCFFMGLALALLAAANPQHPL